MLVREMVLQDLDQVVLIEHEAYEFPWSRSLFEQAIHSTKYCLVLEQNQNIQGYGIVSYVVGEAELLNICIASGARGQGHAQTLLEHLVEHAQQHDNHEMFLEVRPSNQAAIHIYEKQGFHEIGRRKNYYPTKSGYEDALLMALPL
ncbi:ribosomal protein S18-alanine N-acetyltransferase [Bermanella sp. R86510]|uniref:ribosomal protein S18-alanine N-acetyltransferase n=1 Tax=unclassified Bermanella TaxID=2627862 RepID=UPI0037CB02C9